MPHQQEERAMTENDSKVARDNDARRLAILTGGSRGIGGSSVMHLAARGVNVIFTYHSNNEANEQA
jgi:NAD(P)-dependent dehydrogenase (short-subunit alcohol dehydrogenase family)